MLAIIQEIGVIQSVIIAACLGFMLGILVVIFWEKIDQCINTRDIPRM